MNKYWRKKNIKVLNKEERESYWLELQTDYIDKMLEDFTREIKWKLDKEIEYNIRYGKKKFIVQFEPISWYINEKLIDMCYKYKGSFKHLQNTTDSQLYNTIFTRLSTVDGILHGITWKFRLGLLWKWFDGKIRVEFVIQPYKDMFPL